MKSYRDYLDDKAVPQGPWCLDEKGKPIDKTRPDKTKVVQLHKPVDKSA